MILIQKLFKYFEVRGTTLKDNIVIWRAKILYGVFRFFFPFLKLRLGDFITKDVIAVNSYGKFYCRRKDEDLPIICEAFEFKTIKEFKRLLNQNSIVVDVGAHIGKYTILSSRISKKVIAIEPDKANYEILLRNINLNKLRNVVPLNLAAYSKNTPKKLYKGDTSGHHSLQKKSAHYEVVDCIRLDSLLRELGISEVDLLKIDVEGVELEVLKGISAYLRKRKIRNIIVEIFPERLSPVVRYMKRLNYRVKKIENSNYLFHLDNAIEGKCHELFPKPVKEFKHFY